MSPKRKRNSTVSHIRYEFDDSDNNYDELIDIPNPDHSGDSDAGTGDEQFEDESNDHCEDIEDLFLQYSYRKISKTYTDSQNKLEHDHIYRWVNGEKVHDTDIRSESLLTNSQKAKIRQSSYVELFEMFFSDAMKNYVMEATNENGYNLSKVDLETFLGVIILSSFNKRKSQRDYWSSDDLLSCNIVQSAMSRTTFEKIKSHLKCSKLTDKNLDDKAWKV